MTTSTELRIPTQTFLLPGQEFCIGLPWERGQLPVNGVPRVSLAPTVRLTLRGESGTPDALEGHVVGSCTVLRRLSEGGARTLLAIRRDEERPASLVVMRKLDLPEVQAREVRTHAEWASYFTHPGLVPVFPCEVSDEGVFWVCELASGATLHELAVSLRKTGQSLPMGLVLGAVTEVARALGELHTSGAAHGLVSEQAVAVGFDGSARLHDTGLFRCLGQGTSWMELREAMASNFAPEQLLQGRLPDPKTDVFSLGAVLYEALTGERVRRAKTFDQHVELARSGGFVPASKFNMLVNEALEAVLAKALSVDRAQRYANGRELAQALSVAASSFTWKPERRGEFVARHFGPRHAEDQSLRAQLALVPPPPPRRPSTEQELESVATPVVAEPTPRAQVLTFAAPAPVVVAAPRPSTPPRRKKKRVVQEKQWPTVAAFFVAAVVSAGVAYAVKPAPVPKPPPPPLVWLEDVSSDAERVEAVEMLTCLDECSREPELLVVPEVVPTPSSAPVVKKRRVARRDDVPLPPWLVGKRR